MGPTQRSRVVFIAGATGYLGYYLVEKLRGEGWHVIAGARDASESKAAKRLEALGAEIAFRDAAKGESWAHIVARCDSVVSCMAASLGAADNTSDFWAIDRDANIKLGGECAVAGVGHFLLFATFEGPSSRRVSAFSEAKEAAVDAIRATADGAGMRFTVIRANAYFKDLPSRFFDSVLRDGSFSIFGGGRARINPIHGADVAEIACEIMRDPSKMGKEYPIGGPDIFTFREIGMLAGRVIATEDGVLVKNRPLAPLRVVAFFAGLAGLCSRSARRKSALLNWMVYALTHDAVAPSHGHRRLEEYFRERLAR